MISILSFLKKIPQRLISAYTDLINAQPSRRLNPSKFLNVCQQSGGFMDNHFVETLLFLENIQVRTKNRQTNISLSYFNILFFEQIKDQAEKNKLFTDLTEKLDDFPQQLCLFKILPQLLNAYEFGNAGSAVLPPLFKVNLFNFKWHSSRFNLI
jgi:SCY1-like protein 1